jgi:hypothetical protein
VTAESYSAWKCYPSRARPSDWVSAVVQVFSEAQKRIDSRLRLGMDSDRALIELRPVSSPSGLRSRRARSAPTRSDCPCCSESSGERILHTKWTRYTGWDRARGRGGAGCTRQCDLPGSDPDESPRGRASPRPCRPTRVSRQVRGQAARGSKLPTSSMRSMRAPGWGCPSEGILRFAVRKERGGGSNPPPHLRTHVPSAPDGEVSG